MNKYLVKYAIVTIGNQPKFFQREETAPNKWKAVEQFLQRLHLRHQNIEDIVILDVATQGKGGKQ